MHICKIFNLQFFINNFYIISGENKDNLNKLCIPKKENN